MTDKQQMLQKISSLEHTLKALKEENEVLTDRAEDFLLLGIISEKIGLAKNKEEVIDITLESISSLKDMYYSAYLTYEDESVTIVADYAPLLDTSFREKTFPITEEIIAALREEDFIFACNQKSLPAFIPDTIQGRGPKCFCMIPIQQAEEKRHSHCFLFVCYSNGANSLQSILPLLCRGIEIACVKIESIELLLEVNKLNESLENEVKIRTAEAIKTSALLSSLIDSIPDIIFYKTRGGTYLGCNTAFCAFTGRPKDKIVGCSDYDFFEREQADLFREKDRQMLQQGKAIRNEEWVTYPDGKEILLDTLKTPFYGPDNNLLGLIGISRDITEQKRTEKELLKMQKLESVGVLAGGIAHDFNNILAAILGNIDLALFDKSLNSSTRNLLSGAEKASLRARDLTQQLLTFSKGGEPVKETASLETVIKESAKFVLHGKKVACQFNFPEDLWLVDVDKSQISQVIQNIVINASHAIQERGKIVITCENAYPVDEKTLPAGEGRKFVKILIQDNGTGIPPKVIDKIFDPYYSTKQEGSGLGLAICQSIINKHNGYIFVESAPGEGTTFIIYLPASDETIPPGEIHVETIKSCTQAKILIMDDDEMVQDVAKLMLNRLGNEVVLASDGAEAIDLYKEAMRTDEHIQLLIMDLTVPNGMGGKEAVQEIHKLNPEAKVIVSSGYSNDPIMANYRDYGFCAAINKPFQLQDLSKILNMVL